MTATIATYSTIGPRQLVRFRAALERQRRFRAEQLVGLRCDGSLQSSDPAVREIAESLQAGARAALHEIRVALRLMDHGRYGRCAGCQAPLPIERLQAVPQLTRCPACQRSAMPG